MGFKGIFVLPDSQLTRHKTSSRASLSVAWPLAEKDVENKGRLTEQREGLRKRKEARAGRSNIVAFWKYFVEGARLWFGWDEKGTIISETEDEETNKARLEHTSMRQLFTR